MSESPVFFFDNDDPQMQQAYEHARATFRFFWRELAWEYRRIVPGLDMACVKAPFFDEGQVTAEQPPAEQMWVSDIGFDGRHLSGTLINSPQWITSVAEGDPVQLAVNGITDWMYAINGRVYGAFTVNLMRSRMPADERAGHDEAWGLDFGDPAQIELVPPGEDGSPADLNADHPMSINMGGSLREYLDEDADRVNLADDGGWTMLHHQALAGSTTSVAILLERGADPNVATPHGMTALHLAQSLGWPGVERLLTARGAR